MNIHHPFAHVNLENKIKKTKEEYYAVLEQSGIAWLVLDTKFLGVPQRRKRICLVADFAGGSAGKVLFESKGVSGYSAEDFRAWQGASGGAADRIGTAYGICSKDSNAMKSDN